MTFSGILLLAAHLVPGAHGPSSPGAVAPHSVAEVNDPMSHGVVGDNLLSLNEAIQLFNRTLTTAQLSPSEAAQLSGAGADIAWARIDASFVPNITVEQDFDVLINWPHGLLIEGYNGRAQLDFSGPNVNHGFRSNCDFCNWRNLEIYGGPYAIDITQADAAFGGTVVQNVTFDGQQQYAIRIGAAPTPGWNRLIVGDCVFVNVATAITFDGSVADRTSVLAVLDSRFVATSTAIDCLLGVGGQATYLFENLIVTGAGTGIRIQRPAGADRPVLLEATHLDVTATDCFAYEGLAGASSNLQLRMLDLTSSGAGTALSRTPPGGEITGVLHDCTVSGDAVIETGGAAVDLDVQNLRMASGNVTFGTTAPSPLSVSQSRFDNCSVSTSGQRQVAFTDCCFVTGSLQGTNLAPVETSASFASATIGAHVNQAGAVPSAQLGSMNLSPTLPAFGGSLSLVPDLPQGMVGFFVLGVAAPVSEPLPGVRAYCDMITAQVVTVFVQLQQPTVIPIPVNFSLLGTDWMGQIVVLPGPGMQAPDIQAPPGGRFSF